MIVEFNAMPFCQKPIFVYPTARRWAELVGASGDCAVAVAQRPAGALAESEGHHPDLCFGWGYCTVVLYTHKIKGLHENEFIMAAKINALAMR